MIGVAIGSYFVLPTLFDVIVAKYKKNKTLKIIKSKLSEKGYNIDNRMEKDIVGGIIIDLTDWDYYNSAWGSESWWSFVPVMRWIILIGDIKYLCGDYTDMNEEYRILEDIVDNNEDVIKYLKNCGYISIDEEKMQWINDRNNALKELEGKYDEPEKNKKENVIEISKNDDLELLKLKRKLLDEMIELKKSQKENDNILEKEIKKQNNDVELDNLSLKYTPDKKKKN